ncbi:MAG: hypothetical protein Kow0074_01960 [Candidatus Zixiibacteriota bacterium]
MRRLVPIIRMAMIAVSACTLSVVSAQASWNAGNYLKLGVGARPLGMGNAFVAVADDATAIYWNPAAMTISDKTRVFVSYADRFGAGVQDQNAGIAFHWRDELYIGFGFIRSHIGDIKYSPERRTSSERPTVNGTFEDAEVALVASGAMRFSDLLSLGVTVKYLTHELAGKTADGIGFDFGAMLTLTDRLILGANTQNINRPRINWKNETSHFDRIPANIKLGASYAIVPDRLRVSTDFNVPDHDDLLLNIGGEYTPVSNLSLRGGFNGEDLGTGASIGWQDVQMDYAYYIHDIGDTHRITLLYKF